jgi:hypothetical protein
MVGNIASIVTEYYLSKNFIKIEGLKLAGKAVVKLVIKPHISKKMILSNNCN